MARPTLVLVLAGLVLLGSAQILWLALTKSDPQAPAVTTDVPGMAALDAATATLPLALTYDYRDLPGSLTAATAGMTPEFAVEFRETFRTTAAPLARQKQAVTDASVRAAGVVRLDDAEHALCLVYIDQLLVSSDTMKRQADPINVSQNRVLVDLVLTDGIWLVDGIQPQ
ncbi:MAG: hypothetical protein WBX17_10285 [Microbacterium sp.]